MSSLWEKSYLLSTGLWLQWHQQLWKSQHIHSNMVSGCIYGLGALNHYRTSGKDHIKYY